MKKVLLIQGRITHYRVPVFNELAKRVDLTVLYSVGDEPENINFKVIKIPIIQISKIVIFKKTLRILAKKFDAVIAPLEFNNISIMALPIKPRPYKVIYWSIGVPASYDVPYDSNSGYDSKYIKQINRSDACVFYSSYPVEKYTKLDIGTDKMFVANNTVQVLPYDEKTIRKDIIFLGSLYRQKKIFELLDNYKAAYCERRDIPDLIIVGDGDEYVVIKEWIKESNLDKKIILKGAVYDEMELSKLCVSAIACISPGQAGLTVLKVMGYGVPFITTKDAVTGGELFNIKNGENGIILETYDEIKNVILEIAENKEKYIHMGNIARKFYEKNRQVSMMVDGFENAFNFVFGDKQS